MRSLLLTGLLLTIPSASAAGYRLPFNLGQLSNPKLLQKHQESALTALSPAQKAALSQNGFVIRPANWKHFDAVYEATRYAEEPLFITTDSVLHIYHLIFDKLLRDLERQSLAPISKRISSLLVKDAQKQYEGLKNTPLAADARRALAYLAVAQKLADPTATIPSAVAEPVKAELALIDAHQGISLSPIFQASELKEDYSQYVPRGHYTRSEALKRYFRSTMWLSHLNLRVKEADELRTAALITELLNNNPEVQKLWQRLYNVTSVLIGQSDDLNYQQYAQVLKKVTKGDLQRLADETVIKQAQQELSKLSPPRVNSVFVVAKPGEGVDVRQRETRGFRLMGQRFTLDAAAFQQLLYREVGTQDRPRTLPRGLDLLAAMGSDAALNELKKLGDDQYLNYLTQLQKVRGQFAALTPKDWNANVYSGWLYVLQAFAQPEARDGRYPAFMRTPAWTRKEWLTALGSWTELRHDTILYAKQTMAEMGAGLEPPSPLGYVEPNLAVWSRLLNLEQLTRQALKSSDMLSTHTSENLNELRITLERLQRLSGKELSGQRFTQDEKDYIHFFGGWLEQMKMASSDGPENIPEEGGHQFDEDNMAAVVADVATDGGAGLALEEGTGFIHEIYVLVPNGKGGVQVARGGVYSQYEFDVPLKDRLTDEAWRKQLKAGKVPATHPWLRGVLVK